MGRTLSGGNLTFARGNCKLQSSIIKNGIENIAILDAKLTSIVASSVDPY